VCSVYWRSWIGMERLRSRGSMFGGGFGLSLDP
jgi:hypothetical protein